MAQDEIALIQSMCRMVGKGSTPQITILPAEFPDEARLRALQTYATSHGAVLSVDHRGGLVIQGGESSPARSAVRMKRLAHHWVPVIGKAGA